MSHVDEMTCLLYLEGQLERPRALELSAHVEGCGECRALLHALERESRLLVGALVEEDEALPARIAAPPARGATPWAWIVSFGLAAAGAYTLWTGIIEPWQQQMSQAGFGGSNLLTLLLFRGALWKGWGDMLNLLQVAALATLGIVTFSLLRRSWRRWTTIAVVMGAVAAALMLPQPAGAAEIRHKAESYVLAKDEVIKNDLILLGTANGRIDGTVDGDLIFFGRSLEVNGHVTGDIIGFAQLCEVNGTVDGNLRIFANTLLLRGPVSKNVTVFAEHASFKNKSRVGGGAMLFVAGDATFAGRINRDLLGFIKSSTLDSYVGGDVSMRSARMTVSSNAEVAGKFTYRGPVRPDISPQAKLASPPEIHIEQRRPEYESPRFYWHFALQWGAGFIFGLVVLLLMPGFFREVVRSSSRYGPALGFGALTLFAIPILAVITCITIVGLAVGIGALLLWIVAFYSAQIFVSAWLGETLLGPSSGTGGTIGRMALGILIYKVARLLPYIGFFVVLGAVILGMGGIALALYNRTRSQTAMAAGPAAA
jgi:hypothetical protein